MPLIPGARAIPSDVSARSGAFLMAATRDDPSVRPSVRPNEPDLDVRSALISCLEALTPYLEPGWSHCAEHPSCLAVQEASRALWGGASGPIPGPAPAVPFTGPRGAAPDPANLPDPRDDRPEETARSELKSPVAPPGAGP